MRAEIRSWRHHAICAMGLFLAGCASTGAPPGWLPTAEEGPRDCYGAWISVRQEAGHGGRTLVGEFLAVGQDSIFVLDCSSDAILAVAHDQVKDARIAFFDPRTGQASGWVATGSISTLSHGLGAALSLPVWLIAGGASAGSHSRTPLAYFPDRPWQELRMYARFPQGPPPGIRELGLRRKPGTYSIPEAKEVEVPAASPVDWTR